VGCFDIFSGKSTNIVGNISVIDPDNVEVKGYTMVIYQNEHNATVLDGYIVNVAGNDTVLLVESIDKKECNELYHKIKHNKGQGPLNIEPLSPGSYSQLLSQIDSEYDFSDDTYVCP